MKLQKHSLVLLLFLLSVNTYAQQTRDDVLKNSSDLINIPFENIKTSQSSPVVFSEKSSTASTVSFNNITSGSEVGATVADLSVTSSGGANYTVPIVVPPGIKNMAPNISLTFNSQSSNGIAGWGWNISGLSTITRIPSTTYHDGIIDPVDFDSTDRYALNGQRLMLKSGSYGASNSEYQTESYSNIVVKAHGVSPYGTNYGPSYFIVYYPNGSRAWFGNAGGSRSRLEWAIYKLQDAQGNYIQFSYTESDGILQINEILYGSNIGTSAPPNSIRFTYKNRVLPEKSYVGGHLFKRSKILEKILVFSSNLLYRKYQITHETLHLGYEKISQIQEFNRENKPFTPVLFDYGSNAPFLEELTPVNSQPTSIAPGARSDLHGSLSGDFDADGKMDFITYKRDKLGEINLFWRFFNSYNGSSPTNLGRTYQLGKFDAILSSTFMAEDVQNNKYKVMPGQAFTLVSENYAENNSTSDVHFKSYQIGGAAGLYGYDKVWKAPTYVYNNGASNTYNAVLDINGSTVNKYEDQIIANHSIYNNANVTYGVSEQLTLKPGFTVTQGSKFHGKMDHRDRRKIPKEYVTGDFNGDGIVDVLAIQKSYEIGQECHPVRDPHDQYPEVECSSIEISDPKVYFVDLNRAKTTDFANLAGTLQDALTSTHPLLSGDFDGDGKSELFHFREGGVKIYSLNKSNNLVLIENLSDIKISANTPKLFGDYNGDGKIDFATPTSKNDYIWRFFTSTGTGFNISDINTSMTYKEGYGTSDTGIVEEGIAAPFVEYHYIAQDFNADGKTDLIKHKVVTPYAATDRSFDRISYYFNQVGGNSANAPFSERTYEKRNQGNQKYGIPVFLDANTSSSNLEYGYIGVNSFFAYQFNRDVQKETQLNSISNNGFVHEIAYGSIGGEDYDNIYTSSYQDGFPYVNINLSPNLKLVSKIIEKGSGIERSQRYSYGGATSHVEGLGFLGFRTLKKTNWDGSGVTTIWNISKQNPQLRGATVLDWSSTSPYSHGDPSNYISKSTYDYTYSLSGNKVFSISAKRIIIDDAIHGITSTKNITYDQYNNPLSVNTTSSGGSNTENYTYYNNTASYDSNYHVGRIKNQISSNTQYGHTFTTETEFVYDSNLVSTIKKKGNNTDWLTESMQYDNFGNIITKSINAQGIVPRITRFKYDPSGRFIENVTDIEGLVSTYDFNPNTGNLKTYTNPYGQKTSFIYDGWNRVTSQTNYLNKTTHTSYKNESGSLFMSVLTDYPEGQDKRTFINRFGWPVKSSVLSLNNKWISKSIEHDILGRIKKESQPYFSAPSQWDITSYDQYGRPVSFQMHTGKTVSTTYSGLTSTATDGVKTVTSTKDAWGNIAEVTDSGGTVSYNYYANGIMKSADYGGNKVEVEIDGWGRKTRLTDPSAGTYTYAYNAIGELIEETTPKGLTSYKYDNYGKLIQKKIEGENTALQLDLTYNAASKMIESITGRDNFYNKSFQYTYAYDANYRPSDITEITDIARFEKSYTYDAYDRVSQEKITTTSTGQNSIITTKNSYDTAGIRNEILDVTTGKSLWKVNDENHRGQALTITLGNGVVKSREYDAYGFMRTMVDTHTDTQGIVMQMSYIFNGARGTLTSRNNLSFNWQENFDYDNLDRLTAISGAVVKTQSYDTKGRIVNNSTVGDYTYQTNNKYQLKEIGLNTVGDQYYEQHAPQEITYNAFKKPVEIREANNGRVSFEYGPLENRSHAWYGGLDEDKLLRRYHKQYSSITPVEVIHDKQDNTYKIITYLDGDAYTAPIAHIKKNGVAPVNDFYYLHRDYLGSILAISDANGEAIEKRQFGAWGTVDKFWSTTGSTEFNYDALLDRGYTGHEHFFSVSLIHMNGRMYDPQLGRFLSPDNYIQNPYNTQNFNRYGYVLNNPLIYNDPTGEMTNSSCVCETTETPGLTNVEQVGYGSLIMTIANNWDEWRIGDWLGTNIESVAEDIATPFREAGRAIRRFFGEEKSSGPRTIKLSTNQISIDASTLSGSGVSPILISNSSSGTSVSVLGIANYVGGLKDSFKSGFNNRVIDIVDFVQNDLFRSDYYKKSLYTGFNNLLQRKTLLSPSDEYLNEIYDNISNMSANDFAYAAGYSTPDLALTYGGGYALSSLRFTNGLKIGFSGKTIFQSKILGYRSHLFGRYHSQWLPDGRRGFFNRGPFRTGWGNNKGKHVFRTSIGNPPNNKHIDWFYNE
ncbi:RHS repeat-associated core domain-containing protein [Aquimarina intermedia]|uniref:RHS repeat-associated protein n=1 Tax=Aquimarina intermedia TaxID=350814 RepID=A0A5S5CDX8_9FLAO|nr:RHS repeat-associated core domain-containing protein [Aquimarina intermedia]TYP76858.1 RHS repeat-associated protein [Aquimarina intermedia]